MHLIRFLRETEGLAAQCLACESIGLVDIASARKSSDRGLTNIADGEIRVQRLFVDEQLTASIPSLEFHFQFGANRHAQAQMEVGISQTTCCVVGRKRESDLDSSAVTQPRPFDRPLHRARETMGGPGLAFAPSAKPREDDRYAAANRVAWDKQTLGADKKDGMLRARHPMGEVGALQIQVRFRSRRRDDCTR